MIRLLGKGILLMPVIYVVFGNVRSIQLVLSFLLWCKHMAGHLMRNHLQCKWQWQGISRPLKADSISDPNNSLPLSPSNLLTMKWKIILQPPRYFSKADLYSCRRWRQVQHIVNEFWCCWMKEFLQSLQERKKWRNTKRNLKVGDIVILQEANTIRDDWHMCRVMETYCDEKEFVWSVKLEIWSVDQAGRKNIVNRPVSKVVLLLESEEVDENVLESLPMEPQIKCNAISRYHKS